jgi:hypothetical protein
METITKADHLPSGGPNDATCDSLHAVSACGRTLCIVQRYSCLQARVPRTSTQLWNESICRNSYSLKIARLQNSPPELQLISDGDDEEAIK